MHGDLDELVVESLRMKPPPNVFDNICELMHRSACNLTKLCLIAAVEIADDPAIVSVLSVVPSLVELCILSRWPSQVLTLDNVVAALVPMTPCLVPRLGALTFGGYQFA